MKVKNKKIFFSILRIKSTCFLVCVLAIAGCSFVQKTVKGPQWQMHVIDSTLYGADGVRAGFFNKDKMIDLISGGEQKGVTRVYINKGKNSFDAIEFNSPDVEDAIFTEIDKDGNMGVFTMSEGETKRISYHFLNEAKEWKTKHIEPANSYQWMYAAVADLDKDGSNEIVVGGKGENGMIGWLQLQRDKNGNTDWLLHKIASAGWIMSIECFDINNDGAIDILVSDRIGVNTGVKWFKNPGQDQVKNNWMEIPVGLNGKEPMFLTTNDFNDDGLMDIIATEIKEGVYYFENLDKNGLKWEKHLVFQYPAFAGKLGKSVAVVDIDNNRKLDIITSYAEAQNQHGVLLSKRNGKQWKHYTISGKTGIKYDKILLQDMDSDGDMDIVITEERTNKTGLGVVWYENPLQKK